MKKILLTLVVMALVAAGAAQAITQGQPDGNGHPNVGLMLYQRPSDGAFRLVCSGSLVSPTVFLTASHCTSLVESRGVSDAYVTFDSAYGPGSTLHHGTMHTNPAYNQRQSDPGDIAVIVLDQPVAGITPVDLPPAGLLDDMKKAKTLNGTRFTSVGYGVTDPYGSPDGVRRVSVGEFNALTSTWLKVAQTAANGNGGTCYGDSGGPQFLGAGASETNVQVSITITGDSVCRATSVDYRLDTPQARGFLGQFVSLP